MPRNPTAVALGALWLAVTICESAGAHDIWLHADDFTPAVGELLVVRQLVGEELALDDRDSEATTELPVLRDMTSRFELVTADGSVDLMAELPGIRERRDVLPVLERRVEAQSTVLVAMDHDILYTGHSDEEFLDYLHHEGLDPEDFRQHMGADGFQDEGYQRFLKALVRVGDPDTESPPQEAGAPLAARPIGQALELLLLADPYTLDPGDSLEVRALLRGEPLAGATVKALSSRANGQVVTQLLRTDTEGVARLTLDLPGRWLLRLVHLAPCSPDSGVDCGDTEWESYWSAFSFETE